jgi:hypothetical protein
MEPMLPLMRISSVGGKVQADKICLGVRIQIRWIEFPFDLVVMGTHGIDVILWMNWLHKNQAVISYGKRTVKLVAPSKEEIVDELIMSGPRKGDCHHLTLDNKEANPLETIKDVSKFSDEFLEELPGMPPERKVEFAIEFVPSTTTISKIAYRVSVPELVELKKQIDKMLEKDYIRPSISPWAALDLFVEKKDGTNRCA